MSTASSTTTIATARPSAPAQSIFDDHHDPTQVNAADPLVLFIIQIFLIIVLSRLLGLVLKRLRQPKVISEVIGGIMLGPSVFGQINGFSKHIFPTASLTYLTLTSNIGLVLFLFLVGLEVDFKVFRNNAKKSLAITIIGMVVPFALGVAVSVGLYDNFIDSERVGFNHFLLFIGVAMAITAFPVLARILAELKLLADPVGLTVLAAGVGNDVVGWILLALSVALANASSGVTTVYILLTAVGWILVLFFLVKPVFHWFVRRQGGRVTNGVMTITILLVFISAWVTDVIGIHPIFGGFLAGLIMPKGKGFETAVTEKIEDLVSILLLPIYFALSGLKTDLSLLKDGSIWGWTICVIVVAFFSKFLGCAITAYVTGFGRRESLTVGALMSCKGLVELIVLNVGLSAGILNQEVFAIFVVMALVTTFATTPLTLWFYPPWYRDQVAEKDAAEKTMAINQQFGNGKESLDEGRSRFLIVLSSLEHLPPVMALGKILRGTPIVTTVKAPSNEDDKDVEDLKGLDSEDEQSTSITSVTAVTLDALKLVELSERTSTVFKAFETDPRPDPLDEIFSTFISLENMNGTVKSSLTDSSDFSSVVKTTVEEKASQMVIVPWVGKFEDSAHAGGKFPNYNPFENVFGKGKEDTGAGASHYSSFVRNVFRDSQVDVSILFDRSFSSRKGKVHVVLPFFGGRDDRVALELLVQLARNENVYGTVMKIERAFSQDEDELSKKLTNISESEELKPGPAALEFMKKVQHGTTGGTIGNTVMPDTVYAHQDTQNKLQSDSVDAILLNTYFGSPPSEGQNLSKNTKEALAKVSYEVVRSSVPLKFALNRMKHITSQTPTSRLLILAGRGRRSGESHAAEEARLLKEVAAEKGSGALGIAASSDVRRTLGAVGTGVMVNRVGDGLVIVQAALGGVEVEGGKKDDV